jgi:hypothetical protein
MATLTTTGGREITFKVSDIDAIADHNDTTGEARTCVYGVFSAPVMIDESVLGFLKRLEIEGEFAQFTRPNGWLVWINGSSVSSVRAPQKGEFAPSAKSVISTDSLTQCVKEGLEQVIAAVNAHGGTL